MTATAGLAVGIPAAGAATPPPTAPPGYHLVRSGAILLRTGTLDTGGQVVCPTGTVPWGGGAGFTGGSPSVGENVNTSVPTPNGWQARYNNAMSRPDDHFALTVACAKMPARYIVRFATADNPPMTQSTAVASCPTSTVLLGGGVQSTSDSVNVFATSAFPKGPHAYTAVVSNGSARDESLTAFAICGAKPPRYAIVNSSETLTVTATTDIGASASCPAGTSLIGGGTKVVNPGPTVSLGASDPSSRTDWLSEILTATSGTIQETTSAICAA